MAPRKNAAFASDCTTIEAHDNDGQSRGTKIVSSLVTSPLWVQLWTCSAPFNVPTGLPSANTLSSPLKRCARCIRRSSYLSLVCVWGLQYSSEHDCSILLTTGEGSSWQQKGSSHICNNFTWHWPSFYATFWPGRPWLRNFQRTYRITLVILIISLCKVKNVSQ